MVQRVVSGAFLVLWAHEGAVAALVEVYATVKQKFDHRRVLVDDCDVQHVLPCKLNVFPCADL
jgi:hypothetical protein